VTTERPVPSDAATGPAERLIADRYRLGPVIGRGGMATIHRAEDTRSGRAVAIKILRPEIGADPDLADRFRREALAATVLRHRNIVACTDTGTDAGAPYLVMELVEGEDLAVRLRRDGAVPPSEVVRIGLDVARGLGAAHLRGIVHRDVKPGNILLARDGRAMITDFGIARLAMDAEATLPGTTLGSVQYFSPEQAQGATTSPASDVYGLGLVLYEALTGRRPWAGATPAESALARVGATAPSPRDVQPEVPAALDAIVMRCLAPDPADRYPSGNGLAAALEPLVPVRTAGVAGSASRATTRPVGRAASRAPTRPARVGRTTPRRGGVVRLVALLGLLAVSVGGFAMVVAGASPGGTTADATAKPSRTPRATPTAAARSTPRPAATPATILASDVCHPILDVACSLEGARYAPTGLTPGVAFTLGDGWSASIVADDLVVLTRPEGALTFASHVASPDGDDRFSDGSAKRVVAAFAKARDAKATKPAKVTIDGHTGRSVDVTANDGVRPAMFRAGGRPYDLEAGRPTRLVALDDDAGTLVLVIEPSAGHTLRDILDTADVVASTLTFD
jgi:Protein kinase domain